MLPGAPRAEGWGWSMGGGYSRLEYSHERQSSPAGFYGRSIFPELTFFKTGEQQDNLFRLDAWNFNNWKYSNGGDPAPEQKMLKFMVEWEQHRYMGKNRNSLFRWYAGPLAGMGYRRWNLNYMGGTDLTYRLAEVSGGAVLGNKVDILPGLEAGVQLIGKGMVGWYSSHPNDFANSNGIESGYNLGLKATVGIRLTNRFQICPAWSYSYGRDYTKRYSLALSEQRWSVTLKIKSFHAK